jgi:hypothetical protein
MKKQREPTGLAKQVEGLQALVSDLIRNRAPCSFSGSDAQKVIPYLDQRIANIERAMGLGARTLFIEKERKQKERKQRRTKKRTRKHK